MAEIQVERRRTSSATGWTIIVLVLVALLGAGWYFTMGPGASPQADMEELRPGGPATSIPAAPTTGAEGTVTPAPQPGAP